MKFGAGLEIAETYGFGSRDVTTIGASWIDSDQLRTVRYSVENTKNVECMQT